MEDRAIERRLLELAYTTEVKLTAPALAFYAPCSIADASRVLDDLAARDQLDMDIQEDGSVVYHLRGRERIALSSAPPASPPLVPIVDRRAGTRSGHPNPLFAGFLSLIVPGAGHLYAGRFLAAFVWFFVVSLAYVLIIPGLILHLLSIGSAAGAASRTLASAGHHEPRLLRAG